MQADRARRAARMVRFLKKAYPVPKTELIYRTPFQLLVAVALSAQCTDKVVNAVTDSLFRQYATARDFAEADPVLFERAIARVTYFKTKARHIRAAARMLDEEYGGIVPRSASELVQLPGVGYKTAHVVLGELYDEWEGIPTDTHVKRFALRLDLTRNTDLTKISHDLEALVPKRDWKYVNNGLVLYGRYVCPARPHDCHAHMPVKVWPPAESRWPKAH